MICPFISTTISENYRITAAHSDCEQENCALWNTAAKACALLVLSQQTLHRTCQPLPLTLPTTNALTPEKLQELRNQAQTELHWIKRTLAPDCNIVIGHRCDPSATFNYEPMSVTSVKSNHIVVENDHDKRTLNDADYGITWTIENGPEIAVQAKNQYCQSTPDDNKKTVEMLKQTLKPGTRIRLGKLTANRADFRFDDYKVICLSYTHLTIGNGSCKGTILAFDTYGTEWTISHIEGEKVGDTPLKPGMRILLGTRENENADFTYAIAQITEITSNTLRTKALAGGPDREEHWLWNKDYGRLWEIAKKDI